MANKILSFSFLLGIVGFAILFYVRWFKKEKFTKITALGGILFAQLFVIFIFQLLIESNSQKEARYFFKNMTSRENLILEINHKVVDTIERKAFLKQLQRVTKIQTHHSSPTDTILIRIFSSYDTNTVILRKDSQIRNEYWVFWTKYSPDNELGRIYLK